MPSSTPRIARAAAAVDIHHVKPRRVVEQAAFVGAEIGDHAGRSGETTGAKSGPLRSVSATGAPPSIETR